MPPSSHPSETSFEPFLSSVLRAVLQSLPSDRPSISNFDTPFDSPSPRPVPHPNEEPPLLRIPRIGCQSPPSRLSTRIRVPARHSLRPGRELVATSACFIPTCSGDGADLPKISEGPPHPPNRGNYRQITRPLRLHSQIAFPHLVSDGIDAPLHGWQTRPQTPQCLATLTPRSSAMALRYAFLGIPVSRPSRCSTTARSSPARRWSPTLTCSTR
jgi:hypothetical protein